MSSLRPSRFLTPAGGGADPSLEGAILGLSPTTAVKGSPAKKGKTANADPAGGIWRQKNAKSLRVVTAAGGAKADKAGEVESRQCLSPRRISSRHLAGGANLDHPFDEAAHGGGGSSSSSQQPASLPSAAGRSGLKLGNEIKSTDELEATATVEEDDTAGAGAGEEARDDPDIMLEEEESLAVSVDTYLDEVKAPKESEEAAAADAAAAGETPSKKAKKNSSSNKKKGKKGKKSKGKKGGKSKAIVTAAVGGTAPSGLTAANLAGLDSEAPSDEEVDDAYFSLSKSLSGFSSVTGASDLDAHDVAADAAVAATTPKQGTSTPISSQAALRLSLWRDRDTVVLSQTSPTKSRAATAATAAADVIVASQKQKRVGAGAGGPESMRFKSQGELLLPSLCSHAASSVQDESAVDQASSTVSSILARGTATPRGHKSSSKYTFEAAASNDAGGVKKEVSFTQVRDAMRRFLSSSPKADQGTPANDAAAAPSSSASKEPLPSELQAAFWSKCAVLAATAVMATAKTANNRVQIAQAAAETVLSKYPKGEDAAITDEDWRIAASEGMEDLAAEVSSAIIDVGSQGGNIPTVTTAAASAAAVVLLNQKEAKALQIPTAEPPIEDEAAAVDVAAPSVQEIATEEPNDDEEKTPKRAVEEGMIESWRKEENNDESELLSVGDAEAVVTPVPSLDSKDVDTEGESTPPAAAAVATTAVVTTAVAITSDDDVVPSSDEKAEEKDCVAETTSTEPKSEDVADKPTEGDVPTVEAEKAEASPPVFGEDEACCSPTEATSTKEGAAEVESSNETKGETVEVTNATVADGGVEVAPALGGAILSAKLRTKPISFLDAVETAFDTAFDTAYCSPTKAAASSEKTEDADVESKSVLTPAVDIEVKPASAEAEPVAEEPVAEQAAATSDKAAATPDEAVLEVAQDTKGANVTVEEPAKESAVDAVPIKAAETSEAKEEGEIEATSQDEISVTTEPSSNAAKAVVESDASQAVAEEKPGEGEKEKLADDITPDAEEKESIDEPHATAEVSTKSKNTSTQLLEDIENKQKERNAKMDKQLRDFEAYLASINSCASNEEGVVVTCNASKEDGEKDAAAESEDIAKIDAAADDEIASPESECEPKPEPSKEDGEKDAAAESEDVAKIDAATDDEIASPESESESEPEPEPSKEDGVKDAAAESEDVAKIDAATDDEIASPESESEPEPEPSKEDGVKDAAAESEDVAKIDAATDDEIASPEPESESEPEPEPSKEDGVKDAAAESEDVAKIDAAADDEIASPESESEPKPEPSKEDDEKDAAAESEDVAKIDAATDDVIASPEPETASADVEAVIISSESEGETEVSLSGSDTAAKQNATADEPAAEAEKLADVEIETPTMEDATSTLKSDGTEDEKAMGDVVSEKTVTFASMGESTICDTLQGAPANCADNFSSAAKEVFEAFKATVVASCMPTPDVTDNDKSKDSVEEETKESTEHEKADGDEANKEPEKEDDANEEPKKDDTAKTEDDDADGDDPKELAEEIEVPIDDVATKEESEETNEQPAVEEEQAELKPESVDEVDIPTAASADCAEMAEMDGSSVVFCPLIRVDEATQLPMQLPVATEAAIEADAAQPTPAKKATTGKKRFSSVKKIFKKKLKKYEL